jgi:hypothetical protein
VIQNLKDPEGKSLTNIDFKALWPALKEYAGDAPKLLSANDMFGVGTGIISALMAHPQYKSMIEKDGFSGTVCMTGGGCGVIGFRRVGNTLQLEGSESGNIHHANGQPLEQTGLSAPALMREYAKALGLRDEQIKTLLETGNARPATEHEIKVKKGTPEYDTLIKTGLFDEKPCKVCNADVVLLSLKGISKADHEKAAWTGVNAYLDSAAQLCQIKMTEGYNALFLTGPIAGAIQRYLQENAKQPLEVLLKNKTLAIANVAAQSMGQMSNFKIVTDIQLPDNTVGGLLFAQSQPVSEIPYLYRLPV